MESDLGGNIVSKVHRSALFLSRFSYSIEHIDWKDNLFTDILTKWIRGHRSDKKTLGTLSALSTSVEELTQSPKSEDFIWTDLDMIRTSEGSATSCGTSYYRGDDGLLRNNHTTWIPSDALDLKSRF